MNLWVREKPDSAQDLGVHHPLFPCVLACWHREGKSADKCSYWDSEDDQACHALPCLCLPLRCSHTWLRFSLIVLISVCRTWPFSVKANDFPLTMMEARTEYTSNLDYSRKCLNLVGRNYWKDLSLEKKNAYGCIQEIIYNIPFFVCIPSMQPEFC